MIQVFKKIKAECAECGTPLNGVDLLKRGDKYYCPSDYERLSLQEKAENEKIKNEYNFLKRMFGW